MADDEQTCGKGLAEHAVVPRVMGELIAALAENLELHLPTIQTSDPAGRAEHAAYEKLIAEHRTIAAQLAAVATHMTGYRDLAMASHDMARMQDPKRVEAFGRYVKLERELVAVLQASVARDQELMG
ncbi:MAG: hypothetical protein HOV81_44575 [Kofleriaceae bacterium]|nr:hypothetical protein [Kofleriaceae bacterium]